MPSQNFVDPSNRMVITVCRGAVTSQEIVSSFKELSAREDVRPHFRHLVDFSQASTSRLNFDELYRACRACDPLSAKGKRALVVPGRPVGTLGDGFLVFETLVQAISWLGLEVTILDAAAHRGEVPTSFRPMRRKSKSRGKGSGA